MANDAYTKELRKILENRRPAKDVGQTRAELESAIANISVILSGSLNNVERLCLVEERHELRKQLAAL